MPMHDVARVSAERDEILGVKLQGRLVMEGVNVMHFKLLRPAAGLALWLASKMLAANAGPLAGSRRAVVVGPAVEEPAKH